ncbi:hypothetical protein D3C72_1378690 [compost metagenome]
MREIEGATGRNLYLVPIAVNQGQCIAAIQPDDGAADMIGIGCPPCIERDVLRHRRGKVIGLGEACVLEPTRKAVPGPCGGGWIGGQIIREDRLRGHGRATIADKIHGKQTRLPHVFELDVRDNRGCASHSCFVQPHGQRAAFGTHRGGNGARNIVVRNIQSGSRRAKIQPQCCSAGRVVMPRIRRYAIYLADGQPCQIAAHLALGAGRTHDTVKECLVQPGGLQRSAGEDGRPGGSDQIGRTIKRPGAAACGLPILRCWRGIGVEHVHIANTRCHCRRIVLPQGTGLQLVQENLGLCLGGLNEPDEPKERKQPSAKELTEER